MKVVSNRVVVAIDRTADESGSFGWMNLCKRMYRKRSIMQFFQVLKGRGTIRRLMGPSDWPW
jgi:hypothetical protein